MQLRFLGVGFTALAITIIASLPAQARHARHHHHAHHQARHHVTHQAPSQPGGMIYDNDGRIRNGGGMPEFSSLVAAPPQRAYEGHGRARNRGYARRLPERSSAPDSVSGGLAHVQTVVGIPITVSLAIKDRMLALIEDMKAIGYVPHTIGCFAAHGHVPHSRHHSGNACDFDGSLSIAKFFRTEQAEQLIAKHGLHSGCDYVLRGTRDCGHVDDAVGFARASHRVAHAGHRARYRRHYARNY